MPYSYIASNWNTEDIRAREVNNFPNVKYENLGSLVF